ncbi:MAG: response regulator transcription factor [Isosphaeraceae bacterium]
MREPLRIVLVEDHVVVRQGLKTLIDTQPDMNVVGEAGDGQEALETVCALVPEIVVMDISMPRMSGTRATELLRQQFPAVKVLALTAHEDKSYIRQLLLAGVSGYVLKRVAADELIHAIRIVARGGIYLDPNMAGKVVKSFVQRPNTREAFDAAALSEREVEVLRLIAWGHSNKEIATRLDLSVKTVETYKTRSMEKLGLQSRAGIVSYAVQQGWLSDEVSA